MGLKSLTIDEPVVALDITEVSGSGDHDVEMQDMELPSVWEDEQFAELVNASAAVESLLYNIACEGIDASDARKIEQFVPGFYAKNGGGRTFTNYKSIEGLYPANESLVEKSKEIAKNIWDWFVGKINSFLDYFKRSRENKVVVDKKVSELNAFLSTASIGESYRVFDYAGMDADTATSKFLTLFSLRSEMIEKIRPQVTAEVQKIIDASANARSTFGANLTNIRVAYADMNVSARDYGDLVIQLREIATKLKVVSASVAAGQGNPNEGIQKVSQWLDVVFDETLPKITRFKEEEPRLGGKKITLFEAHKNVTAINGGIMTQVRANSEELDDLAELVKGFLSFKHSDNMSQEHLAFLREYTRQGTRLARAITQVISVEHAMRASVATVMGELRRANTQVTRVMTWMHSAVETEGEKASVVKAARVSGIRLSV